MTTFLAKLYWLLYYTNKRQPNKPIDYTNYKIFNLYKPYLTFKYSSFMCTFKFRKNKCVSNVFILKQPLIITGGWPFGYPYHIIIIIIIVLHCNIENSMRVSTVHVYFSFYRKSNAICPCFVRVGYIKLSYYYNIVRVGRLDNNII